MHKNFLSKQRPPLSITVKAASVPLALCAVLAVQGCSSPTDAGGTDGPVELTFLNQSRGQEKTLTSLAEKYSTDRGIKVTVDTPGPADFPAKLQSKAQSKDMPDIYSAVDATVMAPYYKAGWATDLSSELSGDWGKNFTPSSLDLVRFSDGNSLGVKAGTYSACWDTVGYAVLVNPTTLGIDPSNPPATMSGFLDAASKANGKFTIAASITPWLVQSYATNYMTDDEIGATFKGEASWETEEWRKTFQLFAELRDTGAIANNTIIGGSDDNPNAEKSFFNAKTAGALFDASAALGVAKSTAPDFTQFVSIPVPPAADATEEARGLAKPGKCASVNAKGEHSKEALEFLKWLTEPEQQKAFQEGAGTLPTAASLSDGALSDQVKGFATTAANAMNVTESMPTDVVGAISSGAQSIVLGEKSVDDVLKSIQSAQAKS